jgi:iron complex outermembrane recepter protein
MIRINTLIILFFFSMNIFSQSIYEGKVYDKSNKEPLIGVNVFIPDLSVGDVTDEKGNFVFKEIPKGVFNVQFSFIGYKTEIKEIHLHDDSEYTDVYLSHSVIQSQEIVVSGGKHTAQHENAIKIETLSKNSLVENQNISLLKSLSNIPGIDAISKGTGIATPVIRGLSTSNILVLNNGIRLENFQFSENHPYQINEFGVDRIEVIKGPASLLYGSDAIGGVLNIIPESPFRQKGISGDYMFSYNSNTQGLNSNLGLQGNNGNKYIGIKIGGKSHKDYMDGNNIEVPNTRFNEKSLKLYSGIYNNKVNSKLYYDFNQMKLGLTTFASALLVSSNDRENKVWFQDLTNHLIGIKNKFFFNKLKIDANFSFQNNHRELYGEESAKHYKNVDMVLTTVTGDVRADYDINVNQNIIIGVQGFMQNNKNGHAPMHVLPNYNLNAFSLLGMYQFNWNDKLFMQLGNRYDFRFFDIPEQDKSEHSHGEEEELEEDGHEEHEEEHEEDEMMEEFKKNYGNYSFSAGLTYKLSHDLLIRTNIASAFRTPNVAELTQDGIHGNRFELGDRNLKSQRNYEADLSIHYHSKIVMIELASFYNHINNYIHLSPSVDTTEDGLTIYKYIQANSSLYGFESSIDIQPYEFVSFLVSFSSLIGVQENGEYLPFIPQNKLNTSVKLNLPEGLFTESYFKIAMKYSFAQNNPSIYEIKTSDYLLFDVAFGGKVKLSSQEFNLNIGINNLLNTKYYDHLSTLKTIGYYNIGRNMNFRISFKF